MVITNEEYRTALTKLLESAELNDKPRERLYAYLTGLSDTLKFSDYSALEIPSTALAEFGHSIFSLSNSLREVLRRIITFALSAGQYDALTEIISRCAVNFSYSDKQYKSAGDYSPEERTFDRFMEMLATTEIPESLYMPMFLYAADTGGSTSLRIWLGPIKELLMRDAAQNYSHVEQFADSCDSAGAYALLLELDPVRAREKILNIILFKTNADKQKYRALLIDYKKTVLPELYKYIADPSISVREHAIRTLLIYKNDDVVFDKLAQCYYSESTNRIKNIIARECGFAEEKLRLDSFAEMLEYCRQADCPASTRMPVLRYLDGTDADTLVLGAMLDMLGEQRKPLTYAAQVSEIAKHLSPESMTAAAVKMYDGPVAYKPRVLAFCVMYGGEEILTREIADMKALMQQNGEIPARRILLPALSPSPLVKEFYFELLSDDTYKNWHKYLRQGVEYYAEINGISQDDIDDERMSAYKFDESGCMSFDDGSSLTVSDTLAVIVAGKRGAAAEVAPRLEKEIKAQCRRLETAMVESRKFSPEHFLKNIIGNHILNKIAATLFWGEYKFGRLYNIFIVEGVPRDLNNEPYTVRSDCDIMIAHPLDFGERLRNVNFANIVQAFQQGLRGFYLPYPEDIAKNSVERFQGHLVEDTALVRKLKQFGWATAKPLDSGAITHCSKTTCGVTAVLSFSAELYLHRRSTVSIGALRFYSEKSGGRYFSTAKVRPLDIAGMDKRLFSEFLLDVSKIISN